MGYLIMENILQKLRVFSHHIIDKVTSDSDQMNTFMMYLLVTQMNDHEINSTILLWFAVLKGDGVCGGAGGYPYGFL